jgi:hypothetical protein
MRVFLAKSRQGKKNLEENCILYKRERQCACVRALCPVMATAAASLGMLVASCRPVWSHNQCGWDWQTAGNALKIRPRVATLVCTSAAADTHLTTAHPAEDASAAPAPAAPQLCTYGGRNALWLASELQRLLTCQVRAATYEHQFRCAGKNKGRLHVTFGE